MGQNDILRSRTLGSGDKRPIRQERILPMSIHNGVVLMGSVVSGRHEKQVTSDRENQDLACDQLKRLSIAGWLDPIEFVQEQAQDGKGSQGSSETVCVS